MSTLVTFVTNLLTSGESGGSTLVTFVTDFVTFGGSGGKFGDLWGVRGVNFADIFD